MGLSAQAASRICMEQCRAGCCRGPLILRLAVDEVATFQQRAAVLGVGVRVTPAPEGAGWVRFADHAGECCPMLDMDTYSCRIYQDRPKRCRAFPERLTPGCAISGAGLDQGQEAAHG